MAFFMDWGPLYSFSFEVNALPTASLASAADFGVLEGFTRTLSGPVLGPIAQ